MAFSPSPHLANIPQAVRLAASTDLTIDPTLKQQAIDYLTKVKELCEETWQVCSSPLDLRISSFCARVSTTHKLVYS